MVDDESGSDVDTYSELRLDEQICFALYVASNEITRLCARKLKDLNLTFPQYLALLALFDNTPITVGAFSRAMRLDFSTATPLIQRLELAGLVERRRDKDDERRVYIDVTERALALRDKFVEIRRSVSDALGLPRDKLEALKTDLFQLAETARSGG